MPLVTVDGDPFYVEITGESHLPPLVFGNSLSADTSMWDDQIAALSPFFRIIRYDMRGHGRSVRTPPPYTMDRLGQDVIEILDVLGISQVHWCGVSLGGMVGMWLLTNAPGRVGAAVLANTSARMGPPELWNGRIRTAERGGMEALAQATLERWFPADFRAAAPETIERVRAMILATPVAGYVGCCAAIREMDQRQTIRTIRARPLVVIGLRDPATTPADGRLIAASIPGARLAEIDAAHISNIERADEFNRIVREFLLAS
ncbi:3-oxoadipate enol-lactonase [Acuticoccus mangrovi]|uniref:3-oxoadipate enol-lactonase n=1 Tax=Acuticoccus mangrovi TaxID=2796142 RepID=A0A934IPY9_9HYPH|nr:3-oxoadipate enol-lactonase [Acuticoccus mangrovi]MBJ3778876.1 3-oxoadipate enol-lactonase [Acuticoccus mangrovi]